METTRAPIKTIAVNCRLLQAGKLEGIGWFTYETLKRITQDHPEVRFYFIFDRPFDPDFIFSDNVFPVVLGPPTRHPLLWYYWFEWRLPRFLKSIKADLFLSPDGYLSLRSKVSMVPVIHDINFVHRPKDLPKLYSWYYNRFFPKFAKKANRICTVSNYSATDIAKTFNISIDRISVAWNGASQRYQPLPADEIKSVRDQYAEGFPYFVFVGSLHPRKNLANLLQAYRSFQIATGSKVRMVVVGEKMWNKKTKETYTLTPCYTLATKRLESNIAAPDVIFTGRLEQDQLRRVVGGALALTFVPWFEGFGIPVLEAMQSGVPVLTSDCTSLPEVGGEAALYSNPGDLDMIAKQMTRLANDDKLRDELIQKGLEQSKKFSWDQTAKALWECIEMVD